MFGRKILFLAAGYVAGNVVSSLYADKKGKELQSEMKKAKKVGKDKELLLSGFMDTQKNFFKSLESMIPKEHKKTYSLKKKEAFKAFKKLQKNSGGIFSKLQKELTDEFKKEVKK